MRSLNNKGVFITICLIIVLGTFSTYATRQYISENSDESALVSSAIFDEGQAEALPEDTEQGNAAAQDINPQMQRASLFYDSPAPEALPETSDEVTESSVTEENIPAPALAEAAEPAAGVQAEETFSENSVSDESLEEGEAYPEMAQASADDSAASMGRSARSAVPSETVVSPLAGKGAASEEDISTAEEYRKRFEEIDATVKSMRESDAASSTDSLKNIADYEYRLWDTELNRIYKAVISCMTDEEAEKLQKAEREWIRNRDAAAGKAAAKYKGGSMEGLEYTASLAGTTRSRVYEILDTYGHYLPEETDG